MYAGQVTLGNQRRAGRHSVDQGGVGVRDQAAHQGSGAAAVVVVDRHTGGRGIRAELATSATMAVHVDQPRQQRVSPGPASRGLRICPLLRKLGSLASKGDPVTVQHHGAVVDDGERCDKPTGQKDTCVGPHVRMMDRVEVSADVGVDLDLGSPGR